jgi:hypothetical protein
MEREGSMEGLVLWYGVYISCMDGYMYGLFIFFGGEWEKRFDAYIRQGLRWKQIKTISHMFIVCSWKTSS